MSTGKSTLPLIVITLLLSLIGFLTGVGVARNIAFVLVFSVFDFLLLTYIRKRLTQLYGDSRAIKLFVYGFGLVVLLVFILQLFGVE